MTQHKSNSKEEVISSLKEWASPILIGLVGMLLWRDVSEMRSDIKLLLTQQSADKVRIEKLESEVSLLKNYVFIEHSGNKSSNEDSKSFELSPAIVTRGDEYYEVTKNPKQKK
jgi:hypothetical protein